MFAAICIFPTSLLLKLNDDQQIEHGILNKLKGQYLVHYLLINSNHHPSYKSN